MTTLSGWTFGSQGVAIPMGESRLLGTMPSGQRLYAARQAQTRPPMWYEASIEEQLLEVGALGEGWDGYGAASIDTAIVNNVKSLLTLLINPPDYLLPSVSGTILIEWEGLLGRASLEIGLDTFGFYTAPKVGKSIFLGGSIRGLELGDIDFAVSTIVGGAVPHSLETINWNLGFESLYEESAAAA